MSLRRLPLLDLGVRISSRHCRASNLATTGYTGCSFGFCVNPCSSVAKEKFCIFRVTSRQIWDSTRVKWDHCDRDLYEGEVWIHPSFGDCFC
jgi:hypothetical protein